MDKIKLKELACAAIDANKEDIIQFGEARKACPELGYAEYKTADAMKSKLESLGVADIGKIALTGLKGWMRGRNNKSSIMVLGEMDAVISPQHPFADKSTGAAHACGHAAQLAVLAGCAHGIGAIITHLDGDVCFVVASAEEFVQIEERQALRKAGSIAALGGKQQMIIEGAFDDVDMAMMVHALTDTPEPTVITGGTSLGFIGKEIRFIGKEAHAGTAPWQGVNALNAASLAIQAIHALRETFQDEDMIRVHPIITKGGDIVNTVPADVRISCFVRGLTFEAVTKVNKQVNRAIKCCAEAIGATVEIEDIPGYVPLMHNPEMDRLFAANAKNTVPDICIKNGIIFGGSTDMGDVSWLIPSIHPRVSGFTGALHSADFDVADPELAYILPAKLLAMTVIDLLADGADSALQIKNNYPRRAKEDYISTMGFTLS